MPFAILRTATAALACTALTLPALAHDYPAYERQSLYVPVRDGTRLAMNVYRPADADGVETERLPVIFVFTPYRARFVDADGKVQEVALDDHLALRSLLRAGYVVAVADIRGKGASFGARRGFQDRTEAQDGHDLVQWLAEQPWSSGEVGMVGCSYLGGTTTHVASTAPPALKAIFTGATDWDKYEFVRRGGITAQFNTRPDEELSVDLASVPVDADPDGALLREAVAMHAGNTPMAGLWYGMPYRDSVSEFTGNAFWDEVAIWKYAQTIREAGIATYMWSNWKDEPTSHILVAAQNLDSRLLVGPGSHCVPPPGFDFTGEITRYFDYHLKGIDNGFGQAPRVTYYRDEGEGESSYVTSEQLPGAASETLSYYLGADGGNVLGAHPVGSGSAGFAVDYGVADDAYFAFWPPSLDGHGVTFDSAPASEAFDLLGYPVANISVSADRPDADVFVYLEDVAADGEVEVLSFGRLKLSHRKVSQAPWDTLGMPWHSGREADVAPLPEGEAAMLSIAMMPLSHRVMPGHRLRFLVTGADPRQRNLADLVQDPAPRISVHYGWDAASRIDLPLARHSAPMLPGQIGRAEGSGDWPAIAQDLAGAQGYTVYRPLRLPDAPMPVVLWGNGGCRDNGLSASHFLREIASHGYLVIANGKPGEERPVAAELPPAPPPLDGPPPPPSERPADETSVAGMLAGIDLALAMNADPQGPLHGAIDPERIATMGHSCGGLQALAAGADPRIGAVMALGSGVYIRPNSGLSGVQIGKDDLLKLHSPVAYVLGGPSDIAWANGNDDFARIDHVPVVLASLPVGHGGTFALENGGQWAKFAVNWLDWQLRADEEAQMAILNAECPLCSAEGWTISSKGFE